MSTLDKAKEYDGAQTHVSIHLSALALPATCHDTEEEEEEEEEGMFWREMERC
jgi:hypothetical protein